MKNRIKNITKEEAVVHNLASAKDGVRHFIGKREHLLEPLEKMELAKEGLTKQYLSSLKQKANLDYEQLSGLLQVSRATLINKGAKEKFNPSISERIFSIAEIYAFGYSVFEQQANFNNWVLLPNRALGGIAPFELLNSAYGREEVKNLIGRIAYGVYA